MDENLNESVVSETVEETIQEVVAEETAPVEAAPVASETSVREDKAFKQLEERIKSKSEGVLRVELQDDMSHLTVRKGMNFSNVGKRTADDYRPTPEELKQINQIAGIDLNKNDVYSFVLESADDQVDRQGEAFDSAARDKAALLSINKAFLTDHTWDTAHHIGTIYDAKNENGNLLQKVFVMDIPENNKYIKNMLGGVYNKVSVGFSANLKDMHCMSCGNGTSIYDSMCPHMPGGYDEKGMKTYILIKDISDYYETSLVPIPAQRNAGIRRRMSLTVTPEMLEQMEKSTNGATTDGVIEKVDTINSGNTPLGDVTVPETTTTNSTREKTADVFTADTPGVAEVDSSAAAPVTTPATVETKADADDDDNKEKARTTGEVAGAHGELEGHGMPTADAGKKPKPPKAKKSAKKLAKVAKQLKETVKELKDVAALLKSSGVNVSELAEGQKSLSGTVDALKEFVATAMAVTVEQIDRASIAKQQNGSTTPNAAGNQWAVDLTKGILGGK